MSDDNCEAGDVAAAAAQEAIGKMEAVRWLATEADLYVVVLTSKELDVLGILLHRSEPFKHAEATAWTRLQTKLTAAKGVPTPPPQRGDAPLSYLGKQNEPRCGYCHSTIPRRSSTTSCDVAGCPQKQKEGVLVGCPELWRDHDATGRRYTEPT